MPKKAALQKNAPLRLQRASSCQINSHTEMQSDACIRKEHIMTELRDENIKYKVLFHVKNDPEPLPEAES